MEEGELNLKELIIRARKYIVTVLKGWKKLFLIALLMGGILLIRAFMIPPTYEANLTFMVNEEEGNMGGMGAILGQFGFGGGTKSNLSKMLELLKSKNISQQVLFERVEIDGNKDYLANHIIRLYELHESWGKEEELKNFYFSRKDVTTFNKVEHFALKKIYFMLMGGEDEKGLITTDLDDDTDIMSINVASINEQLSINISKLIFAALSDFYIKKTTEKQQTTYDIMVFKADSLKELMTSKEYSLANFKDSNKGIWTTKQKLKELRLQRDIQILMEVYGVALKNLEIADFTLKNKTPFIQLIDEPVEPIEPEETSKLLAFLIGAIGGGVLGSIYILLGVFYKEIME